ncbi:hypothetical protein ACLK17_19340 [Escherichia coli]
MPETNTNIAVSYYRYTNDGYFSFDEPIPVIGTITVAKKVKFNSTSARQYLMG